MSYTLVVVDMQPDFDAANNRRVIANVKQEIQRAINAGAPVIVLEYRGFGRTNRSIDRMVRQYEKGYFVSKSWDDGSPEVLETCNIYDLPRVFRIVGVNYGACVRETALGLAMYNVIVVRSACHQPRHWKDQYSTKAITGILSDNNIYVEV